MGVDGVLGARALGVDDDAETRGDFEAVYRRHFPALMRTAFLMTGSNAVAEDLVHDVFVRCADRLPHLDNPASYLRAAVVNACRRHHRQTARFSSSDDELHHTDPPAADAVAVRRALMTMGSRRRAAVVLRYYHDLPHDEIADALGCRTATARSLVRRGLNDLRGALDEH